MTATHTFTQASSCTDSAIRLALSPALTPEGLDEAPSFFRGFATSPKVVARSLLTLSEITSTRYFRPVPVNAFDPVLSAHGDRLRAEVFSACGTVAARCDLLSTGLDGGEIGRGTTNVDLREEMRRALSRVRRDDLLHLDIGDHGLVASTPQRTTVERPVRMPERWPRALGNTAEISQELIPALELDRASARRLISSLPTTGAGAAAAWLSPAGELRPRPTPGTLQVAGSHRLSALRRLVVHALSVRVYASPDCVRAPEEAGAVALEVELPGARFTLTLTAETHRGFSGEGSLLLAMATPAAVDDADLLSAFLAFDPVIDARHLARGADLTVSRTTAALSMLASSGRVGWDVHSASYFHRELPYDPARQERDNPRLVGARKLRDEGAVLRDGHSAVVVSGKNRYRVGIDGSTCTCGADARLGDTVSHAA